MANQDEKKPPLDGALITGGEASARAYAEAELPESSDTPTAPVGRVRLVPPSQTPTVRLADLARRPGPRAPDQMVRPTPKGPVELPEGRPVTERQAIEIDPDVLVDLSREMHAREEARRVSGGARASAPEPEAEAVREDAPPMSRPASSRGGADGSGGKRPALVGAVIVVAVVAVLVTAALRGPKGGDSPTHATASAAATVVPSATAAPSAAATVSTAPSALVSATAMPAPSASVAPQVGSVPDARVRAAPTAPDPYTDPTAQRSPAAPAPVVAPAPAPEKTATNTPAAAPKAGTIPEF